MQTRLAWVCIVRKNVCDNAELREEMVMPARQKPRYGYRRLHVLEKRGHSSSPMRLFQLYQEEPEEKTADAQPLHVRANQEWALDFVADTWGTGRGIPVLNVVDAFTCECLGIDVDTGLSSRRVTRALDQIIEERGKPDSIRCDNGPELTSRHILG
jgi:putative transposase